MSRQPPNDNKAEAAVLGSVLLDNRHVDTLTTGLTVEDFYREGHREIYKAMLALSADSQPIDTVTLVDYWRGTDGLKRAGGGTGLVSLINDTPAGISVEYYAKIVRDLAMRRRVISAAEQIAAAGYSDEAEADVYRDQSQASIFEATRDTARKPYQSIRVAMADRHRRLEELHERTDKNAVIGISTGLVDLDAKLGGLCDTDMVVVAGRPSMGKTALGLTMTLNMAARGHEVGVFSLEMSCGQLSDRLSAMHGGFSVSGLRSGRLRERWDDYLLAMGAVSSMPIFLDDSAGLRINELASRARIMQREVGIEALVVDYIQLMQGSSSGRRDNRQQEITEISAGLKRVAKELAIPVVVISQLNRGPESRPNKRPSMADLRESGAIEQDADVILLLYRPEYYKEGEKPGVCEVNVGKQRNGPTGTLELHWDADTTRFKNLATGGDYSGKGGDSWVM